MEVRKRAQERFQEARGKISELQDRENVGGKVIKATVKGVKTGVEVVGKVSAKVVDKTTKFIGLERYRRELEAALDESTRVIAAQEARIALLEAERNAGQN